MYVQASQLVRYMKPPCYSTTQTCAYGSQPASRTVHPAVISSKQWGQRREKEN